MTDKNVLVDIFQNADILEPENAEVNCLHADNFCQNCHMKLFSILFLAVELVKKVTDRTQKKAIETKSQHG